MQRALNINFIFGPIFTRIYIYIFNIDHKMNNILKIKDMQEKIAKILNYSIKL